MATRGHTLEAQLRRAVEEQEFRLYYQPQIEPRTGRLVGAEVLLRWLDPETGVREPRDFLGALERAGLIMSVGEWVIRQATEDCRRWRRLGCRRLRLGVNLSAIQLNSGMESSRALDVSALASCCALQLEVDAHVLNRAPQSLLKVLRNLQFQGAEIVVQGFGTDDGVRDMLWCLPVDAMKIDSALVRRVTWDNDAAVAMASAVAQARAYRMGLIALGAETPEQLERLVELGCREVQGFVFGAAMPADRFERLLGATCKGSCVGGTEPVKH